MKNVSWYVQTNLVQEHCVESIKRACLDAGVGYYPHTAIPFSESLELPSTYDRLIPYGSTTLIKNFGKADTDRSGLFFDPEKFRTSEWIKHFGTRLLNGDAIVAPLDQIIIDELPDMFFIKPDNDLKDFSGGLVTRENLNKFIQEVSYGGYTFKPDIPVVISTPKNMGWEWRLFMSGDKIITGSSYRLGQMLNQTKPVSDKVKRFARDTAQIWRPDECFVLDVAEGEHGLKIVEFNCINASGFYSCDINKIVKEVSRVAQAKS